MLEIFFFLLLLAAFVMLYFTRWSGYRALLCLWHDQSDYFDARRSAREMPSEEMAPSEDEPLSSESEHFPSEDEPASEDGDPLSASEEPFSDEEGTLQEPQADDVWSGRRCSLTDVPEVSVVVVSEGNGAVLEENLPYILRQTHPSFEVIVVDAASADTHTSVLTSDALKRLQQEFPHLRRTYVPQSSRNIDRRLLGYTLGIRAARAPWVAVIGPDCVPESYDWLSTMMCLTGDDVDVVIGYANYFQDEDAATRRASFGRLRRFLFFARAVLGGHAVGADSCNVVLRRAWFLEGGGFPYTVGVPFSAISLLVDSQTECGRVALALYPDTFVRQLFPDDTEYLAEMRIQRRLAQRLRRSQAPWMLRRDTWADTAILLFTLSFCGYVVVRVLRYIPFADMVRSVISPVVPYAPFYDWKWLLLDIPAFAMPVASVVLSVVTFRRLSCLFEEASFGAYPMCFHFLLPWRKLATWWKCRKMSRTAM